MPLELVENRCLIAALAHRGLVRSAGGTGIVARRIQDEAIGDLIDEVKAA